MWGEQVKLWNVTLALIGHLKRVHYDRHKIYTKVVTKGGSRGGPFKLMLLCVQAFTAKGHPKFRKAREGKTAFRL